eukprot:229099-Chlamydomonas_euryale.AAC.10
MMYDPSYHVVLRRMIQPSIKVHEQEAQTSQAPQPSTTVLRIPSEYLAWPRCGSVPPESVTGARSGLNTSIPASSRLVPGSRAYRLEARVASTTTRAPSLACSHGSRPRVSLITTRVSNLACGCASHQPRRTSAPRVRPQRSSSSARQPSASASVATPSSQSPRNTASPGRDRGSIPQTCCRLISRRGTPGRT